MIRLPPNHEKLSAADRYALAVLVDLSRLLPATPGVTDAVRLEVVDDVLPSNDLRAFAARGWFLESADGVVRVPRATLQWVVEVGGGCAEQHTIERDRYGRVPSGRNPAVQVGLERTPIISAAGVALRSAVVEAAGRRPVRLVSPWPDGKRWAVAVTHDLDVVEAWPAFTALRVAELIRKGRVRVTSRVVVAALRSVWRDPVWLAARTLLAHEKKRGVLSTWFVLCGIPNFATMRAGDLTYRPDGDKATRILTAVASAGHEIGLHGSFETGDRPEAFVEQRSRLQRLVGSPVTGVRQHYLRMVPGDTQRGMRDAGFAYDATAGFPDRNGFRLGVADVVPWWDAAAGSVTGPEQVPMMWMDRALSKYQGIEDPDAWVEDAAVLAAESRAVEGAWVGVWHPNLTPALGFPGAPAAYERLLDLLLASDPCVLTLSAMVAWRRWRRSARVAAVTGAGQLDVRTDDDSPHTLHVEDVAGHLVQVVRRKVGGEA